jgi:predicted dehydrogenase
MAKRLINLAIIGGGLMGKELASAIGRWFHLLDLDFQPRLVAVSDLRPETAAWFAESLDTVKLTTTDYHQVLEDPEVEAVYCAIPHQEHQRVYTDIIRSGKHLLGEKPFGIDLAANQAIVKECQEHPEILVRCSSEFPFHPGSYQMIQWLRQEKFGRIFDVEAGFWHSSDYNPLKPINWKRKIESCGEYGVMGDLGMHVVHIPLRFGWMPQRISAVLSKIVNERPDGKGGMAVCETWDNAMLACEYTPASKTGGQNGEKIPMLLSTKRIAPGNGNTWFIRVSGTSFCAEFTTQNPKQIRYLSYTPGGEQAWQVLDLPHKPPYKTITGEIFEFGFSDSMLQMLAAFCDELVHGREGMKQPFYCATPEETLMSHQIFTAALESYKQVKVK